MGGAVSFFAVEKMLRLAVVIVLLILLLWLGTRLWVAAILVGAGYLLGAHMRGPSEPAGRVHGDYEMGRGMAGEDTKKYGAGRAAGMLLNKEALRVVLRNTKKGIRTAAAATATAASMGTGGDTLVEVSFLALDAAEYLAVTTRMLAGAEAMRGAGWESLKAVGRRDAFRGGPPGVHAFLEAARGGPPAAPQTREGEEEALAPFCAFVRQNIEKSVEIAGSIISSFIPNDSGTVAWVATEAVLAAIRLGAGHPFALVAAAYAALPQWTKDLLEEPERLGKLLNTFLDYLEEHLFTPNSGKADLVKKFLGRQGLVMAAGGLLLVPGLNFFIAPIVLMQAGAQLVNVSLALGVGHSQVRWMLENILRPQIAVLVELVRLALPACFVMLYWLERCQGKGDKNGEQKPGAEQNPDTEPGRGPTAGEADRSAGAGLREARPPDAPLRAPIEADGGNKGAGGPSPAGPEPAGRPGEGTGYPTEPAGSGANGDGGGGGAGPVPAT